MFSTTTLSSLLNSGFFLSMCSIHAKCNSIHSSSPNWNHIIIIQISPILPQNLLFDCGFYAQLHKRSFVLCRVVMLGCFTSPIHRDLPADLYTTPILVWGRDHLYPNIYFSSCVSLANCTEFCELKKSPHESHAVRTNVCARVFLGGFHLLHRDVVVACQRCFN